MGRRVCGALRRSVLFLLGLSMTAGCEDKSRLEQASAPTAREKYDGPSALELGLSDVAPGSTPAVRLVDDEAVFKEFGVSYIAALAKAELSPAGIHFESIDYGRGLLVIHEWSAWAGTSAELRRFFASLPAEWKLGPGLKLAFGVELKKTRPGQMETVWRSYVVRDPPVLDGHWVARADTGIAPAGNSQVTVVMEPAAVERFKQMTSDNVGRKAALMLGDWVIQAPVINETISEGRLVLNLAVADQVSPAVAKELAQVLSR